VEIGNVLQKRSKMMMSRGKILANLARDNYIRELQSNAGECEFFIFTKTG